MRPTTKRRQSRAKSAAAARHGLLLKHGSFSAAVTKRIYNKQFYFLHQSKCHSRYRVLLRLGVSSALSGMCFNLYLYRPAQLLECFLILNFILKLNFPTFLSFCFTNTMLKSQNYSSFSFSIACILTATIMRYASFSVFVTWKGALCGLYLLTGILVHVSTTLTTTLHPVWVTCWSLVYVLIEVQVINHVHLLGLNSHKCPETLHMPFSPLCGCKFEELSLLLLTLLYKHVTLRKNNPELNCWLLPL